MTTIIWIAIVMLVANMFVIIRRLEAVELDIKILKAKGLLK